MNSPKSLRTFLVTHAFAATLRTSAELTAGCSAIAVWLALRGTALRSAYQLIFLGRMTLGQATEVLDERDQLSPEVMRLLRFLESQHQGRYGRAREHGERLENGSSGSSPSSKVPAFRSGLVKSRSL